MSDYVENFLRQARELGEMHARRAAAYTGGPKYFEHNGHKREASMPWLTDEEMAGTVRMLLRSDFAHELIVCAARDRILHLSQENARLSAALEPSTPDPRDRVVEAAKRVAVGHLNSAKVRGMGNCRCDICRAIEGLK